jgi:hypothetical protein
MSSQVGMAPCRGYKVVLRSYIFTKLDRTFALSGLASCLQVWSLRAGSKLTKSLREITSLTREALNILLESHSGRDDDYMPPSIVRAWAIMGTHLLKLC